MYEDHFYKTQSTFWNRVQWSEKNTFPQLSQSTERNFDYDKWTEFWKSAAQLRFLCSFIGYNANASVL